MKKIMIILTMLLGAAPICANSSWEDFREDCPNAAAAIEAVPGSTVKVAKGIGKFAYDNLSVVKLPVKGACFVTSGIKNYLTKNEDNIKSTMAMTALGGAVVGSAALGVYGLYQHPDVLTSIPFRFWDAGKWLVTENTNGAKFARFIAGFSLVELAFRQLGKVLELDTNNKNK